MPMYQKRTTCCILSGLHRNFRARSDLKCIKYSIYTIFKANGNDSYLNTPLSRHSTWPPMYVSLSSRCDPAGPWVSKTHGHAKYSFLQRKKNLRTLKNFVCSLSFLFGQTILFSYALTINKLSHKVPEPLRSTSAAKQRSQWMAITKGAIKIMHYRVALGWLCTVQIWKHAHIWNTNNMSQQHPKLFRNIPEWRTAPPKR